ncbi:MAG: PKD domain-containing protein [Bacteroidetes bacterium]|nr:PKD domain-containing protein [Bacteroidota bacterium]
MKNKVEKIIVSFSKVLIEYPIMKGISFFVQLFLCILPTSSLFAQSYLEFVENKGQWDKNISFKGEMTTGAFSLKPDGGYRMLLYDTNSTAFINSHSTKFLSATQQANLSKTNNNTSLKGHVYEVKFLNANPNPIAVPEKASTSYNNYFIGNDKTKWATNCKIYQAITYKNIYPNIDVRYYTNNGSLKYDLIVNPGGDPNNIALYFDGADAITLNKGALTIKTSVSEVKEKPPISYLINNKGKQDANCNFEIKGNIVKFKFKNHVNNNGILVIDPQFVFSTFSGSKSDNWGYTATYDNSGNFYLGGIVFGSNFPVSNGAFQTNFKGGSGIYNMDMGIMKLNPSGTNRIYATYIGGATGGDQPQSMVVDGLGNLTIAGRSASSDYPTTNGRIGSGGGWDIVVTKLNANGTALIGSVAIGGSGDDGVNIADKETSVSGPSHSITTRRYYGDDGRSEVIVDAGNNVYVASCTQSADFPTTANAFQKTIGAKNGSGRAQDAVFIKLNSDLSNLLYATFLGGSDDDAAFVLSLNPSNGNVYIAGGTASADFPGNKGNSLYQTSQGNVDGFVSIFSNDGSQLIQTAYFGTSGIDLIYGIQFDKFSYPYIMGTTTGNWPVVNAPFSQAGGKQFIAKLQPDLSNWVYSTIFGTNSNDPNLSPTAFLIDRCDQAYVSGWGGLGNTGTGYQAGSTNGMSVTADAIQKTTDGSDFYFFVLAKNAQSQLYGSFFGQNGGNYPDHVDGGTSRFDRNGIIYQAICANCGGGAIFPTTPGVWSPTNQSLGTGGGECNMAAIKIAFNLAGIESAIKSKVQGSTRDTSGCLPLTVNFSDSIAQGKSYVWDYGDGTPKLTTTIAASSHTFNLVGTFKVSLVSIDSNSCNIADTSHLNIRIGNDSVKLSLAQQKLPPCTSFTYQFTNNSYLVSSLKQFKDSSFVIDFGDGSAKKYLLKNETIFTHTFPAEGTYFITLTLLDTNFCNYSDYMIDTLRIASNVKASFQTPALGCNPYNASFTNTSSGGLSFLWNFGDGTTSTQTNPTHLYAQVGIYTITLTANDPSTCNQTDVTSFTITVADKPTAAFSASPQPPIANTPINFTNTSTGANWFKYTFGDGDSVITTSTLTPVSHIYNLTNTYTVCLTAKNASGCTDVICNPVQTLVNPLFDVPNAFTPNGDGINDKIFVNGYGILTMNWKIYNRWGELLFVSNTKAGGWDGTYKGVIQPQDVYSYILEIELSNGTKYTKKGNITLLR